MKHSFQTERQLLNARKKLTAGMFVGKRVNCEYFPYANRDQVLMRSGYVNALVKECVGIVTDVRIVGGNVTYLFDNGVHIHRDSLFSWEVES